MFDPSCIGGSFVLYIMPDTSSCDQSNSGGLANNFQGIALRVAPFLGRIMLLASEVTVPLNICNNQNCDEFVSVGEYNNPGNDDNGKDFILTVDYSWLQSQLSVSYINFLIQSL